MRLLRKIFRLLHQPREVRREVPDFLPACPAAPDWSLEHQVVLNRFLATDAGDVFLARMRAVEADLARRMVQDVMHTSHSAGRAAGFGDAVKWVNSLRKANVPDEANEFSERSSSASDDTLAGVAEGQQATDGRDPKGEDRLLERYSP